MVRKKKPVGWRNKRPDDPWRHAQAARGVKTGSYIVGPTNRERKLQAKLGRKTKAELIKMGDRYGFMFDESASKADMVVELATAIMEASLTGVTPGQQKELQELTLEFLATREPDEPEDPLVVIEEDRPDDPFGMEREQVIPRPVAKPPAKFVLDFSKMESAFTENTTYYGGYVTVNGVEVDVPKSDREAPGLGGYIGREVEKRLGRVLTDDEHEELEEVIGEARHGPQETHLPAVVEWHPKEKQKTVDVKSELGRTLRFVMLAKQYINKLDPAKTRFAQEYLNYYMGRGPRPDQPGALSPSDVQEIKTRIQTFF